jgi:hypothetical protein
MGKTWAQMGVMVAVLAAGACGTTLPSAGQQSEEDRYRVTLENCVDDAGTLEASRACRAKATAEHRARIGGTP